MMLGVIADDFTGASDIGLMLSSAGMSAVQYVGIPAGPADPSIQAGIVALKIRTAPVDEAVRDALYSCEWLLAQGCTQVVYKICSTFDSTNEGNIGPVGDALARRLGEVTVVVCPAFPENGRSVYQGHLFVGDKLLSESGMENHPLTPMTDADLRRVLAGQSDLPVTHVQLETVRAGAARLEDELACLGRSMAVADAICDQDLVTIGRAVRDRRLLIGGSGIAIGLPANFGVRAGASNWPGQPGPAVILSGSCSSATRKQVALYSEAAPSRELVAAEIIAGNYSLDELVEWVMSQTAPPLLYSSADPLTVSKAQEQFGKKETAEAFEQLFARLGRVLAEAGIKRIVVAGGETSGAVTEGLGASALTIGPRIAPGVPALQVVGRNLVLALKSGNFGGPEFFQNALKVLEGGA